MARYAHRESEEKEEDLGEEINAQQYLSRHDMTSASERLIIKVAWVVMLTLDLFLLFFAGVMTLAVSCDYNRVAGAPRGPKS